MIAAIVAGLALGGQSSITTNIPYVVNGTEQQKLDLYLPAKRPFKTILFAYGAGWHGGDRKNMAPLGKRFQELGYGCAMIGYRLTPPYKWPAHIDDAADAASWVLEHIAEYGGNAQQVWLAGHSSGAQLVTLLATDATWLAKRGHAPTDFKGVIGISTPVDLEPHHNATFGDALMAGAGADAFHRSVVEMKKASPINHIKGAKPPPILLLVADEDMPGLVDGGKRFAALAAKAGLKVSCYVQPERNHMLILSHALEVNDPAMNRIVRFIEGP